MRTMPSVRASILFHSLRDGLSVALPAVLMTVALACAGCNEAPLLAAPDAGIACTAPQLEAPCVAQDAGLAGCTPDLQSEVALGKEVTIGPGSYPLGCTVIVNSSSLDQDNQCTTLGSCNCQQPQPDGGAFAWVCVE
jgi:hypothetical protein